MANPFYGAFLVDLLTGALINENTGGDKTKQAARATEISAIAAAFQQINSGNATAGIAALTAAVSSNTALSPAETQAAQNLIVVLSNLAAAAAAVGGGTILGQVETALLNNVLNEVIKVCAAYGAPAPAAKS